MKPRVAPERLNTSLAWFLFFLFSEEVEGCTLMSKKQDIGYSEETRLALLEQSISHINETLQRFEKKFDQMESKIDSHFHWMVGLMFGLYAMGLTGLISALGKAYGLF